MNIRCPHCFQKVVLDDQSPDSYINCPSCGSQFSLIGNQASTWVWGSSRTIAQFELIEQVGVGQFGTVWKARDIELDRYVAVKLPRKEQHSDADIEMLLREARAAAQVKHRNIVSVHEVGRDGNMVYLVSDFIQGCTLKEWLTAQRMTIREAVELCIKVAVALHHAHECGVIHRDLKPGNIMLDLNGEPHLTDFGLARRESGEVTVTADGSPLGTPAYMSPEQARGEAHYADRRTDVYSLGVMLFELLTGELPFRGDSRMLIVQILKDEPPSPQKFNARLPKDLETICLKCLEKDPDRRYRTAEQVAEELRRWERGEPIRARPVGRLERLWRWAKRNKSVAGLLASVALVTAIGFAGVTWQWREAVTAKNLADDRLSDVLKERERREVNYERAMKAIEQLLSRVGYESLARVPEFAPVRKQILEDALRMYEQIMNEDGSTPEMQQEIIGAANLVTRINWMMGDMVAALKAQERALELARLREREDPGNPSTLHDLAKATAGKGLILIDHGSVNEGVKLLEESIDILDQVEPSDDVLLALIRIKPETKLGEVYHFQLHDHERSALHHRRALEALELARGSFDEFSRISTEAWNFKNMGSALARLPGRETEAEEAFREAIKRYEQQVKASRVLNHLAYGLPTPGQDHNLQATGNNLAGALIALANLLARTGREEEAQSLNDRALQMRADQMKTAEEEALTVSPQFWHIVALLASAQARQLRGTDREAEVLPLMQKTFEAYQKLVEWSPRTRFYREQLLATGIEIATSLLRSKEDAAGAVLYLNRLAELSAGASQNEEEPGYSDGQLVKALAQTRYGDNGWLSAPADVKNSICNIAVAAADRLHQTNPDDVEVLDARAWTHHVLGDHLLHVLNRPEDAKPHYEIERAAHVKLEMLRAENHWFVVEVAWNCEKLGVIKVNQADGYGLLQIATQAVMARRKTLQAAPDDKVLVERRPVAIRLLADALSLVEKPGMEELNQAIEVARLCVADDESNALAWRALGIGMYRLGEFKFAETYLQKALERMPPEPVVDQLYLGMTQFKSGETEQGGALIKQAIRRLDERIAGNPRDVARLKLLREIGAGVTEQNE